jgi:hypothetical protein
VITTKHDFDVSSCVTAARQIQRQALRPTFHICKSCERPLSVGEFIERHCEKCGKDVEVIATKEPA